MCKLQDEEIDEEIAGKTNMENAGEHKHEEGKEKNETHCSK